MVPLALADGSSQGAAARDAQAVGPFLDRGAQAPQLRRHGGDPIALLHPQFFRTADDGFALGAGRRHAEDRKLVARLGNMLGPDRHPAQRADPPRSSATGSPACAPGFSSSMSAPIACTTSRTPVPV